MSGSFASGSSKTTTSNPQALAAANELKNYLKGLDTSVVDKTYQNIAGNAYNLSSNLPNYIYNVDASDDARQRMENAVYNQASTKLNQQFEQDLSNLNTKLQNQGIAVGSQAYNNAMSNLQNNQYNALTNAAYESVIQGQNAFSNSLNDSINAADFTNSARQKSLNEILQTLQNSISGYDVYNNIFNAMSQASDQVNKGSSSAIGVKADASDAAALIAALSDIRLKENICPVGKLDNGLTVYRFNYIGNPQTQIGLIAQEVKEFRPEAVIKGEDGYWRVNYKLACD